jgi:uncharacterized DUF497 family protein
MRSARLRENEASEWQISFMSFNGIRLKHRPIDFERAATVFRDPFALTIADEEHSETDALWITLGNDASGRYTVVIHTFEWLPDKRGRVRLISARRPTKAEIRVYEEQHERSI